MKGSELGELLRSPKVVLYSYIDIVISSGWSGVRVEGLSSNRLPEAVFLHEEMKLGRCFPFLVCWDWGGWQALTLHARWSRWGWDTAWSMYLYMLSVQCCLVQQGSYWFVPPFAAV